MANALRDLVSSVDWGKMLTSQDAKNALIGSALGGLMLGGAGLAADRDPDESKYAPVGDALMGALLGGVAGYGIPKGLAMFSDSGHLAPPDDRLSRNYFKWGGVGALLGGGVEAERLRRTLKVVARNSLDNVSRNHTANLRTAERNLQTAIQDGRPADIIDRLKRIRDVRTGEELKYREAASVPFRRLVDSLLHNGGRGASEALREWRQLRGIRNEMTRGYAGPVDLLWRLKREADKGSFAHPTPGTPEPAPQPRGVIDKIPGLGRLNRWIDRKAVNPRAYNSGPILGFKPTSALKRMGLRGGLRGLAYGGAGALLATALRAALSPSASDNFKE